MKITPLEIQQKTFKKVRLGGVDPQEVGQYLGLISHEMEEVVRETHRLQETLRQRDAELAEHKQREQLLQTTLTTAQRMTDDLKSSARKEADLILGDAELQAEKIIANAQARRLGLISEIDELKRAKTGFVSQLSGLIEHHRALLEQVQGDSKAQPAQGDNLSFLAPPANKR